MRHLLWLSMVWLSMLSLGCTNAADSRCAALCDAGSAPACDGSSVSSCLADCEARVSGVSSLCATCLLEEASFGDDGGPISLCMTDDSCASGMRCPGRMAGCTYCTGDEAGRLACVPAEIECSASFRPVAECATICAD